MWIYINILGHSWIMYYGTCVIPDPLLKRPVFGGWMKYLREGRRRRVVSARVGVRKGNLSLSLMWGRKANFKAESSPILFSSEEPYLSSEGLATCLGIIWMLIVPFLHWLVEAIDLQTENTPDLIAKCRGLAISLPPLCHRYPLLPDRLIIQRGLPSFPSFFGDFPEINNHPILSSKEVFHTWRPHSEGGPLIADKRS